MKSSIAKSDRYIGKNALIMNADDASDEKYFVFFSIVITDNIRKFLMHN